LSFKFRANSASWTEMMTLRSDTQRIGIKNTAPEATLDVNGDLKASGAVRAGSPGVIFADGTALTSTAGAITFTSSTANFSGSNTSQIVRAVQNGAGSAPPLSMSNLPPAGLRGEATGATGFVAGVLGTSSNSPDGAGIMGVNAALTPSTLANPTTSSAAGVVGISFNALNGAGVYGEADETSNTDVRLGFPTGVYGYAKSVIGAGVSGVNDNPSGDTLGVWGAVDSADGYGVEGDAYATGAGSTAIGVAGFSSAEQGKGVVGRALHTSGSTVGVRGTVESPAGVAGLFENFTFPSAGDILVMRKSTGVDGNGNPTPQNVARIDVTGKGFFNGGTQTSGADFAESFAVRGNNKMYEPGDLLAIDESGNRRMTLSREPYSTLVAGIYSTKPGILATPHHIDSKEVEQEVPLAIVGVVPCKVTTENGPIKRGDLLVSSSKPGYAMKGTDREKMVGAVVGKALEPLASGEGVIEVLVTLQ
ncbi:MAG: hypothetical protein ACE14L_18010, partial [Terriglobales bacterium]